MRRIGFRRAMKKTMQATLDAGAGGIKIACSGPPGWSRNGPRRVVSQGPRAAAHLRADVDYGFCAPRRSTV
jgi:small subunit ribosomal protein S3